jgi:hypothetical protein
VDGQEIREDGMIYYLVSLDGMIKKGTLSPCAAFEEAREKGYQVLQCKKAIDRVAYNKRIKKVNK